MWVAVEVPAPALRLLQTLIGCKVLCDRLEVDLLEVPTSSLSWELVVQRCLYVLLEASKQVPMSSKKDLSGPETMIESDVEVPSRLPFSSCPDFSCSNALAYDFSWGQALLPVRRLQGYREAACQRVTAVSSSGSVEACWSS